MKVLSLCISITFVLLHSLGFAQCWEDRQTATTNWEHYNGTDLYPNDFDWTQEFFTMYLTNSPSFPNSEWVVSPFYVPSSTLYQDNVGYLQAFSDPLAKDFHPEDGWELIHKEFGAIGGVSESVTYPFFYFI